MTAPILRGNAVVAMAAESLGFLIPLGELAADAAISCSHVLRIDWVGSDGIGGGIFVCLDRSLAEAMAGNLLGRMPGEAMAEEEIDDIASELANAISGSLLPALYGADREFRLQQPYLLPPIDPGGRREAAVQFLEGRLVVALETMPDEKPNPAPGPPAMIRRAFHP